MNLPEFLSEDSAGYIHLTGHRIGLQDIVYFYNEGDSPEMLQCRFPTLSLAQIHQTLGFYLANQTEADAYIQSCEAEIEKQRAEAKPGPSLAELRRRMSLLQKAQGA